MEPCQCSKHLLDGTNKREIEALAQANKRITPHTEAGSSFCLISRRFGANRRSFEQTEYTFN